MRKGFISPLILVVLLGAIIGGLVYLRPKPPVIINQPQATSDPFGNWKTYKNQKQSFTIRYPKDLFISEHVTDAVDFINDPNIKEATPAAIKVRYSSATDATDLKEFEKIYKTDPGVEILEPLDVRSIIIKNSNLEIAGYRSIDYIINRTFSALEGPKTEYTHVYQIDKNGVILKFSSNAETKESQKQLDPVFEKIISSLKF
ncbi:hypothetical protein HYU92_05205 [Candidatus Curtissbacteria bacterium]|nr:hypothetical protein [Candidatus Curtissbacteria bacterium]